MTIQYVAATALSLVFLLLLVVALPSWIEREHAATVAAREAAAAAVAAYPSDGQDAGRAAAADALANYHVALNDVRIEYVRDDVQRGGLVSVRVTVTMPALVVPGIRTAGGFHW